MYSFQKDKQLSGSEVAKTQTRCHRWLLASQLRPGHPVPKSSLPEPRQKGQWACEPSSRWEAAVRCMCVCEHMGSVCASVCMCVSTQAALPAVTHSESEDRGGHVGAGPAAQPGKGRVSQAPRGVTKVDRRPSVWAASRCSVSPAAKQRDDRASRPMSREDPEGRGGTTGDRRSCTVVQLGSTAPRRKHDVQHKPSIFSHNWLILTTLLQHNLHTIKFICIQ